MKSIPLKIMVNKINIKISQTFSKNEGKLK